MIANAVGSAINYDEVLTESKKDLERAKKGLNIAEKEQIEAVAKEKEEQRRFKDGQFKLKVN